MIQGLSTRAELELFLVSKRAKPAALITFDAFVAWIDEDRTARQNTCSADLAQSHSLSETDLRNLEIYFPHFSVRYRLRERRSYCVSGVSEKKCSIDIASYYIGQNKDSLTALIQAFNEGDDETTGQALGFPEEACRSYGKMILGVKRNDSYTQVQLARARDAHIPVPSWMAYVTWVPDELDFVAGRVSTSTQELAKLYQLMTREFNAELAQRVETKFRNEALPVRWQLKPDGWYETQNPGFYSERTIFS
ncbi:hypothetical protein HZA99_01695 [Candidatus Woesearchaeota archaeon]|nr:hypothetical protein [Candidatus Woesearchaeota archaeon]